MAEESPLSCAEERVGFHVGGASAGTDAAEFVFDEEFADKGFAKAARDISCRIFAGDKRHTLIFVGRQNVRGRERRPGEYWQKFGFDSFL